MKKHLLSGLFLLTFGITAASAQNGSYYELALSSTSGATGTIKIYYAAPGCRTEMQITAAQMPGGGMNKTSIVKKAEPEKVYQVDDKTKTYSIVDLGGQATDKADHKATATLIDTATVSGYKCKHVKVTDGTQNWEIWTTTAIAEYSQYSKVMGNQKYIGNHAVHEALKLIGAEGFPVKTITTDSRGTFTVTLVKKENKTLATSLFEIPAGYTQSSGAATAPAGMGGVKPADVQKMSPEERQKWIEEMKKQQGGGGH